MFLSVVQLVILHRVHFYIYYFSITYSSYLYITKEVSKRSVNPLILWLTQFANRSTTNIKISTMEGGQQLHRAPRVPRSAAGGVASQDILNVNIQAEHNESIRKTKDFFKAENTVKDHNRRITAMIKWLEKEQVDYFQQAFVDLTE